MNKKKITLLVCLIIILVIAILISIFFVILNLKPDENKEDKVDNQESIYYTLNGAIYEKIDKVNENGINNNMNKINNVCEKYLKNINAKVYFTLIPNKEYYLENSDNVNQDFVSFENNIKEKLNKNIQYIQISDTLSLNSYYKTDMHWKQEELENTVNRILEKMNIEKKSIQYEEKSLGDFYGSYFKEVNDNKIKPDELIYLTNDSLDNIYSYNVEKEIEEKIYNIDRVNETNNKYDLYLSGATAIQKINNTNIDNGKKLIIFRDSFGSSIIPLLLEYYQEVLVLDIRYINLEFLSNYIDFNEYKGQDVLFMYNTRVINKSGIFR